MTIQGNTVSKDTTHVDMPTDLTSYLKEKGINDVVMAGCFDARCVRMTAEAAAKEGFQTVVDRDLNVIFDKEDFKLFPEATKEIFQIAYQEKWDELREEYPNLIVFDPVRYGICELDED